MNDIATRLTLAAPEQAQLWDKEARELAEIMGHAERAWARLGMICALMERHEGWKHLNQHSFGSWMMALETSSGRSRKTAYAYRTLWLSLEGKIEQSDLEQMNLTAAHVVKQLSPEVQKDPVVIELAKKPRCKKLREILVEHYPEQHIEVKVEQTFYFEASQWDRIHNLIGLWRRKHPDDMDMSYEGVIEMVFEEWSQERDERD